MKNRMKGSVCAAVLLAALGFSTTTWSAGNERLRIPQDIALPLYTTGLNATGTNAEDWVVAAFYYPSATIPADYDLFNQPVFDYPVGQVTPLVEGYFLWKEGEPLPTQQFVRNAPGAAVEIWFVPAQNFINGIPGIDPLTYTVNSMKAEGAIVGYADKFMQTWEVASGGYNNTVVASGVMKDGRPFWVKSTLTNAYFNGHTKVLGCIVHFGQ